MSRVGYCDSTNNLSFSTSDCPLDASPVIWPKGLSSIYHKLYKGHNNDWVVNHFVRTIISHDDT